MRYCDSRDILGVAQNIAISQTSVRRYASIQTAREVLQPAPAVPTAVGIDMRITHCATLSGGSFVAPLNSFKKHQQRLGRFPRRMARKVKFSNWKKEKAKVQKVHSQIANARKDFLHKTTTTISQNHALVCTKDLQARNMSKATVNSTVNGSSQRRG